MPPQDIKAVVFDCDGVLFDTAEVNRIYYNRILTHLGRPALTEAQFTFAHMHTVDESLAHLFPEDESLAAAQEFRKSMHMNYQEFLQYMTPEPHLRPLLQKLRPRYRTAIATNRTDTMNRLLSEFDLTDEFELVVTALDVARPKPHPDALLRVLNYFDLSPRQAIYIGDTKVDELATKAAGIPFAAYGDASLSAEFHISTLRDMEQILNL
ncbi:HAD family hydrolase [Desulfonema ishimotonii]|uniref:phosphoglycolate phosphatase n=1 Tax=Desulfonema ishimotonii TaxID=45657 RepID=A0A401G0S7_9BACT|nr:HAD family hydrolase [Desulfonema ishimotonii]GBC62825.1 HAD family hydrolase [Desulfonema ishimotonii]